MRGTSCLLPLLASLAVVPASLARADPVEDFYRGKVVTLSVGYSPGGAYDAVARLLAQYMPRYLPGSPKIVIQNTPGAGTLVLTNQLYNLAPRDGTQFGIVARGMAMEPLLGGDNAKFDARKFTWIGSAANEISMCVTYGQTGVRSWKDALQTPFTVGGNGSGSDPDIFTSVLKSQFGIKANLISSYPGTGELSLALERGEIDGRCGWSWTSIKSEKAKWVAEGKLHLLVQLALDKAPDLPDVPLITDLASTDQTRTILKLIFSRQTMGRPFLAPPGIPADRRDALRSAFDKTMRDPDFLADAKNRTIEINAVSGADIGTLLDTLYATPKDTVELARRAIRGE
jgi:tripartite-type tricarboxylate transporter receptor subunit TctC